jgi:hypothetical protein
MMTMRDQWQGTSNEKINSNLRTDLQGLRMITRIVKSTERTK